MADDKRGGARSGHTSLPSADEKEAQQWHEDQHPRAGDEFWTTCRACKLSNPHYQAAWKAQVEDIAARIEDSMSNVRKPDTYRRGLRPL